MGRGFAIQIEPMVLDIRLILFLQPHLFIRLPLNVLQPGKVRAIGTPPSVTAETERAASASPPTNGSARLREISAAAIGNTGALSQLDSGFTSVVLATLCASYCFALRTRLLSITGVIVTDPVPDYLRDGDFAPIAFPVSPVSASPTNRNLHQPLRNASRSALIFSACVVGMPCGKSLYVIRVPFFNSFADSGPAAT